MRVIAFAIIIATASTAWGQATATVRRLIVAGTYSTPGTPEPPAASRQVAPGQVVAAGQIAGAQPTAAAADPKQQRLQKIQQLTFDRRPSTILRVWLETAQEEKLAAEKAVAEAAKPAEVEPEETKPEPKPEVKAEEAKPAEAPAAAEPLVEQQAPTEQKPEVDEKAKAEAERAQAEAERAKAEAERTKAEAVRAQAEATRKQAELERAEKEFEAGLKQLQRNVTLGRWAPVRDFLKSLEADEAKAAYNRLLDQLRSGAQRGGMDPQMVQQMIDSGNQAAVQQMMASGGQGPGAQYVERHRIGMVDLLGLIAAAPRKDEATSLEDDLVVKLGAMLRQTITQGHDLDELLRGLGAVPGGVATEQVPRRDVARLLAAAGQESRLGSFLPALDDAKRDSDVQALNLLARHFVAKHGLEKKTVHLEGAWQATQAVMSVAVPAAPAPFQPKPLPSDATAEQKTAATVEATAAETAQRDHARRVAEQRAALERAVELAPRVRKELGQQWLDESFTAQIERGREILVTLGSVVSGSLSSRPHDADFRQKSLELQDAAVAALLRASPDTASQWKDALTLLAGNWLREAEVAYRYDNSNPYGQNWRRDRYGNFYMFDDEGGMQQMQHQNQNAPRAIKTSDLLDLKPSDAWLKLIEVDLRPKFNTTFAQLYLKAGDDAAAFPYIEQLAATHPDKAKEIATEFLRVWTRNHNPNEGREQNQFMYYYGYEQRADRIPLTRSKQERNLQELGAMVRRLRALPIGDLDEQLLAQAFTTAHSKAEVYRLESIEQVLGSLETLKPRTLAELIQQMRGNLAGVWRMPDVQKQNSTNRKQRDIQAEVQRGYELALSVVRRALEKHPDHWALVMAEAAVMHDENDFRQELEKSSEFSDRRQQALVRFRHAAELYAKAVPELAEEEQSTQVYEQWYYAALGSVDLARITAEKVPDLRQSAMIREALSQLPPDAAERHMEKFANNLFTRASSAKPELKFRYLKSGFEIVGDHKMAREARKLLDYYDDLVSEIRLEAKVDGPDTVSQGQPFGVFVNIAHTKEIERESGGFGRYLQNQNNNQGYFYNFGRPLQNYRDKFRDTVQQAIGEQFEIVSITFQEPEVNSKASAPYGWRVTPYAYLLLKAKGPEVDQIPPVRLDMDFLDTSGYAMLPVETPTVPIDAKSAKPTARPSAKIKLTQTLDERQAKAGKLILEVRANGRGLMPELDQLVDLRVDGFKQTAVDGGDLSVTQFDKESLETVVLSERIWLVTMEADGATVMPEKFRFAQAKLQLEESIYQRYEDADLVQAEPEIELMAQYEKPSYAWLWLPVGGLALMVLGGVFAVRALRNGQQPASSRFQLPEQVTPFTVLGLLRDIEQNNGLNSTDKQDLATSIDRLERHYFADDGAQPPDLQAIANRWVSKTDKGHG